MTKWRKRNGTEMTAGRKFCSNCCIICFFCVSFMRVSFQRGRKGTLIAMQRTDCERARDMTNWFSNTIIYKVHKIPTVFPRITPALNKPPYFRRVEKINPRGFIQGNTVCMSIFRIVCTSRKASHFLPTRWSEILFTYSLVSLGKVFARNLQFIDFFR